jgi:hypothetical protein
MQYEYVMHGNMSVLYDPHQKKFFLSNIVGVRIVGGKVALIPVVSSSDMTYAIVVSILAEKAQ